LAIKNKSTLPAKCADNGFSACKSAKKVLIFTGGQSFYRFSAEQVADFADLCGGRWTKIGARERT
jgi:hypothetical protein